MTQAGAHPRPRGASQGKVDLYRLLYVRLGEKGLADLLTDWIKRGVIR